MEQRTNKYSGEYSGGNAVEFGAVGKGVALDEIRKILEEYPEVSGAVVYCGRQHFNLRK